MIKAHITMHTGEKVTKNFHDYQQLSIWVAEHHDEIAQITAGKVRVSAIRQGRDK